MAKQFSVPFEGSAEAAVARLQVAAEKNHVHFSGDSVAGQFNVKGVEGRYDIAGNVLNITIAKKPMLIPWPLIETKVREFFG